MTTKLYNGDCLIEMNRIADGSIDLILCDLPFGTTQSEWDKKIPFDELWKQYHRVIKTNGAIVLFGQEPFSSEVRLSNKKEYKYDWIYHKAQATGFLNSKKQPLRNYENVCVFYRKQATYNPQFWQAKPYVRKMKRGNYRTTCYGGYGETTTMSDGKRFPLQIIKFNNADKLNTIHVNQKPVDLLEYLIKTYTNEGETVLDNCMGSGSCGVACVNTNRNFIGIELDENFFNKASEWIERTKNESKTA